MKTETVKSVYSGAHGCACGCRGSHSESPLAIKRKLTLLASVPVDQLEADPEGEYLSWETATRTHIIYFKERR